MKMSQEHQKILKWYILLALPKHLPKDYEWGNFPRSDKVKDLNKRYRWDVYHTAFRIYGKPSIFTEYSNDHIDTVLRKIIKPTLRKRY